MKEHSRLRHAPSKCTLDDVLVGARLPTSARASLAAWSWHMDCRKDSGEILGVHIFGLHAADLIHEASNAVATGQKVQDIKFNVHAHPTLSEVNL